MSKPLDTLLVIDVESTCWKGSPPAGQMSEIIEVGVCPINVTTLQPLQRCSILIKPEHSQISAFCTELTTLTPDMLAAAGNLNDAVGILKSQYRSKDRLWASWGDYDRRQFERVCQRQQVAYPFGSRHLNVKSLYAVVAGLQQECGLAAACEQLGIPMDGTHHRGHDDAWNIANVLCHLLRRMRASAS